jgi:hypothetical protein
VAPIAAAVFTALSLWRRSRPSPIEQWQVAGIVGTGLFASVLVVHMSDQNFWLSCPLTLLLLAMPLKRVLSRVRSSRVIAATATVPLAIIYVAGLSPLVLGYALVCHTDGTGFLREVATPSGSICTTYDSAPIAAGAVRFTSQHAESIAFMPTGLSLYQITGRVPPVTFLFLAPGVTPPEELARVERLMVSLPVEWVIYYKVDFSKDLPADREIQNGSPWQFDEFLSATYQRADEDGLVVYRIKR